jgi:hypothetical protein
VGAAQPEHTNDHVANGPMYSGCRPIADGGSRLPPSDFDAHRVDHDFRAPSCLCASDSPRNGYSECAVFVSLTGEYSGEYIAGCPYGRCGFVGEYASFLFYFRLLTISNTHAVPLERMYSRRGLLIERHPLRRRLSQHSHLVTLLIRLLDPENLAPPIVRPGNYGLDAHARGLTRNPWPMTRERGSVSRQLAKLNACRTPGIPASDFEKLFMKCRCGLVMARRVSRFHRCTIAIPMVIDLTLEDGAFPMIIDVDLLSESDDGLIIDLTGDS